MDRPRPDEGLHPAQGGARDDDEAHHLEPAPCRACAGTDDAEPHEQHPAELRPLVEVRGPVAGAGLQADDLEEGVP